MNAQDLKNSILQLAIQGKLVEQRKEEGTAKELIEEIKAEKEKKIKKEKPLAEITEDEVPFEIPESWEWVKLGQIGMTNIGLTYKPINVSSEGTIVLRSSNIQNGKLAYDDIVKVNIQVPENKICQIGDILICARNGSKRLVGKATLIDKDNMSFGAFMAIYRSICNEYVLHVINSAYFRNSLLSETGTTTINQITQDMLRQFIVPLPPLAEQKRIVAKIEELMPYIEKYGTAHSKLEIFNKKFPEDMQKSILQYAIQGKLVEQREEEGTAEELYKQIQEEKEKLIKEKMIKKEKPLAEITEDEVPFEIPESWKWVRLGEIVSIKGGKRLPAGKQLTQNKTNHIYIRVTDMKKQTIDDTDLHYIDDNIFEKISNYIIEKSDIYIVIVGSTIGKVGLVPERFHGMNLTENAARLIPICMDKDYLMRYLSATAAQIQFIDQTKQVGQPKLALIRLKNTLVPIPPIAEQKRIVAKIEEMLPYCKQLVK